MSKIHHHSETPTAVLLGVDGGGSKTLALVSDLRGKILGKGGSSSSNHHRVGKERAFEALTQAIDAALLEAFRTPEGDPTALRKRIAAACFGLASVDRPADQKMFSHMVENHGLAPTYQVVNDAELVLAAALEEGWGIALVSGTGSTCLARNMSGETTRVGGWGYLLGDEGSGYKLAIRALHLATQTADGRRDADTIHQAVLDHWRVAEMEQIFDHIYQAGATQRDITNFACKVLELASKGDRDALILVEEIAEELAMHVQTVLHRMKMQKPRLALGGGMLCSSAVLREALLVRLNDSIQSSVVVENPAHGAVRLAKELFEKTYYDTKEHTN